MGSPKTCQKNETVNYLHRVCTLVYLSSSINFWFEDLNIPTILPKILNRTSKIQGFVTIAFVIAEWGGFFTQKTLTPVQSNWAIMFAFSHTILYFMYASGVYYRQEVRELMFTLAVRLKGMYNDKPTERIMIRTSSRSLAFFLLVCSFAMLSNGFNSGVQSLTSNATFTTVIPAWPDVEDRRYIAAVARVLFYIAWWSYVVQVFSVYLIVISLSICVSHQFKILWKYFESLNDIFEGSASQADKEKEYEEAFKFGIKMHSITLWCTEQIQKVCGPAFSSQVIINVTVLVLMMMQMTYSERTLVAVLPVLLTATSVLFSTGVFMWNAGDITIEAARLPNAMFFSGWHNCHKSSVRVRKLVTIAMTQAQKRVAIQGFGFVELSYESYVTIVKSSYSLFSVIY